MEAWREKQIREGIMSNTKPRLKLTTTNWKYKGLTIYRDPEDKFYINYHGDIYPINFDGLPKTIQYDKSRPVGKNYTIYGTVGRDQE